MRYARCLSGVHPGWTRLPFLQIKLKILPCGCCAGGYVGEGEHFPVFRALSCAVNGGSAAVRLKADRPHIHGR